VAFMIATHQKSYIVKNSEIKVQLRITIQLWDFINPDKNYSVAPEKSDAISEISAGKG